MVIEKVRAILHRVLPESVFRWKRYHFNLKVPAKKKSDRLVLSRIRERQHANVLFIASSLGMWRYNELAIKLMQDSRFSVRIVIVPFIPYAKQEQRNEIQKISAYLSNQGLPFDLIDNDPQAFQRVKSEFAPDLIFYPQPYNGIYVRGIEWYDNTDCLLGIIPYSLNLENSFHLLDLPYLNLAWRWYLPSEQHRKAYARVVNNRAENAVVVGEVRHDELTQTSSRDPWKVIDDGKRRKRIIWSPHFSIFQNLAFNRPDFLWTFRIMLDIAKKYKDEVQIAFKPHPKLRSTLEAWSEWGKEKTDAYYREWERMPNTQLEVGDYTDLFITSDALIHNCGSFAAEYLFTHKPVAFTTKDVDYVKSTMIPYGVDCISAHYIVGSAEDIEMFVQSVVLEGKDYMNGRRDEVYESTLASPNGKRVVDNIYQDLIESFGFN